MEINKIYCMDCLEGMKEMEDDSVDLILTDPPYNLNKGFQNDNLLDDEYIKFLSPIFDEMARVIKPKHSVIVFFDNGKQLPLFWRCLFSSILKFQKGCTFYKPNDCSMPHNRILRKSEVFYVLSKTSELHHDGEKYIHDCLIGNYGHIDRAWYHPTAKNIGVIKEIMRSHSVTGNLILDPFMGSGTTAVACMALQRNFIGFEIDPKYCDIANKRIEVWRGQSRLNTEVIK